MTEHKLLHALIQARDNGMVSVKSYALPSMESTPRQEYQRVLNKFLDSGWLTLREDGECTIAADLDESWWKPTTKPLPAENRLKLG